MDNFSTINVAAARLGAACLAARSPWANVAAAGANLASGRDLVRAAGPHAAGTVNARLSAAVRPDQAMSVQTTIQPQFAAMGEELLPTTVTVTRKPKNVHKTRINAGGYGAMGPHPERERLA